MAFEELLKPALRGPQPTPEKPEEKPNWLADTALGIPRGLEGAVQSLYDLADFATGDRLPDYDNRFLGRSKTFGGTMSEGITQFLTGFIPIAGQVSKVGKLSKIGKAGKKVLNVKGAMVAGAAADFTMFQAQEERLSNLLETFPALSNPVSEFLAADDDDGEIEGRLKNTLEGLAIGGVVDGLVGGLKAMKRIRKGEDVNSVISEYNQAYNVADNDELLAADFASSQQFRDNIDRAFETEYNGKITDGNAPVTVPAYRALELFDESYTGELKPLITSILKNGGESLKEAKLVFQDKIEKTFYDDKTHTIVMGKGGERTFVHEMVHAVTTKQIQKEVQLGKGGKASDYKARLEALVAQGGNDSVAGLATTYLKVAKALDMEESLFGANGYANTAEKQKYQGKAYGMLDLNEFVTEAFTNPEFRRVLSTIPSETAPKKNMFDEFMLAIKKLLNIDPAQGSVLDDVFKYTDDIVREQETMFDGSFDYLKTLDEMSGEIQSTKSKKALSKPDDYYLDLAESEGYAQARTLDDRGDDFTVEKGQKTPISETQTDNRIAVRGETLEPFKIEFGRAFYGKDIAEVPDSYLKKALEFDSVKPEVKERIDLELQARNNKTSQGPAYEEYIPEEKTRSRSKGVTGQLKASKTLLDSGPRTTESPMTLSEIQNQRSDLTAKEMYQRYLRSRKGGKATRNETFREYIENRGIDKTSKLPRLQGKSQSSTDAMRRSGAAPFGQAELGVPDIHDLRNNVEVSRQWARSIRTQQATFGMEPEDLYEIESSLRVIAGEGSAEDLDVLQTFTNTKAKDLKEVEADARKSISKIYLSQANNIIKEVMKNGYGGNQTLFGMMEEAEKAILSEMMTKRVFAQIKMLDKQTREKIADNLEKTNDKIKNKDLIYLLRQGVENEEEINKSIHKFITSATQSQTYGQAEVDDYIEEAIGKVAQKLNTGGPKAILNMAKNIRTSKHALALISGIARSLDEKGVKETVTKEQLVEETQEIADILGGDKNTWAGAVEKLQGEVSLKKFRNAQRAAKTLMDLMSRDIVDTAKLAIEARKNTDLNLQRLETEFISKLAQLQEVQRLYSLMGKESGLTLLQRNFLGNAKGRYRLNENIGFDFVAGDPESYARYNTQSIGGQNPKDLINKFAMYDSDKAVQKGSETLANGGELTKNVLKGTGGVFGSKLGRMTMEYWMNSLLSGPTTQVVNTVGSGLTTALRMGEMLMGSIMAGDSETRRAILQYAFNMETIAEAFRFAGKAWKINDSVLVQGSRQFDDQIRRQEAIQSDRGDTIGDAINLIGKGVRLPSRGLMTVDEFFKQLNYRMYARTNIAMEALNKNPDLTGKELAAVVEEQFQKYITDGGRAYNEGNLYLDAVEKVKGDNIDYGVDQAVMIQNEMARNPFDPSRSALADAAKLYAETNTFTNEIANDTVVGTLGNLVGSAKEKLPVFNFVVPFVRTPTNILKFSLDRTPVGLASELLMRRKQLTSGLNSSDPMERALTRGKIATGVAFSSAMLWYAMSNKDFITGGGPESKEEKDILKNAGWQPYSFKVGDTYVSYQRLDPIATIIGLFADMAEFDTYHDMDGSVAGNLFSMVALSFTQNVTNKSYVKGLDSLLNALRDPAENSKALLGNTVGGFMPTFFTQLQNGGSERTLRETRNIMDYFVRRSPASEALPAKRNFLGEKATVKNPPMGLGIVNPLYFSAASDDALDQELVSLMHGFNKPQSKMLGAIELKDIYNGDGRQAYDVWLENTSSTKINGRTLRQQLAKLVKSREYQELPAQSNSDIGEKSPRIRAINGWLKVYRAKAKEEMLQQFPDLQQSVDQLIQQKHQYRLLQ